MTDKEIIRTRILAWLGYWRDEMPPEAVRKLQELLDELLSLKEKK